MQTGRGLRILAFDSAAGLHSRASDSTIRFWFAFCIVGLTHAVGKHQIAAVSRKSLKTTVDVLQARVRELKGQGKSAEDAVPLITAEFQAKYPDWTTPARLAPAVRTAYEESR